MQKIIDSVIIGAGLTGLSTAFYLKKAGKDFMVLENRTQPGGVIETHTEKGFVYETGPNTGVLGSYEIVEIFDELNHLCQMETATETAKKRYILKNGKWHALPSGLISAIQTPLFTLKDKFRILAEPFRRKGTNPHETLAQLVRRRMGKSFLEYAVDPFIIGVYAGDPNDLVPRYALPKLYNLEQNYGSFIGGAVKKQFEKKSEEDKKVTRKVFSARGGLSNLVHALHSFCGPENFVLGVSEAVAATQETKEGTLYKISYRHNGQAKEILTHNLIFTGGSFSLSELLPFVNREDMNLITRLNYAKVVEVTLGFDQWDGMKLDGFGGLIPSKENRQILGVLFMSTLFEGRAPEKGALLTVFMGGVKNAALSDKSDEELKMIVEKEITDLMGLNRFDPALFRITRYAHAIPQYDAASGVRFETIKKVETQFPGLILGGNMRDGIGMADRAKQGKMLARQVLNKKA
jgi:protoporphyrinogen/coproporphyrinogen III oxidase